MACNSVSCMFLIQYSSHEISHHSDCGMPQISGVKKKLMALAKEKECQDVSKWIKSITNHLYWTAASSREGDGELMVSKWKSVSGHVQNVHHGHEGQFKKCQHETLLHRVWLKPGKFLFIM
jgi:hypothetical protein